MSELAVDLGTSNIRVWGAGGELLREPAVVTSERIPRRWGRRAHVVGSRALELAERTNGGIKLVQPIRAGGIADFKGAEALLRFAFSAGRGSFGFKGPSALFPVPPVMPDMQQRALRRLALDSGASSVSLVPSSIAVLAGLGVDVKAPRGHMVIEVGGGTTHIAVVSLSSIIVSRSLPIGGDQMDEAIGDFLQRRFNMIASEGMSCALRTRVGAARRDVDVEPLRVSGHDVTTRAPRSVDVHCAEVFGAIAPLIDEILEVARAVLAVTPPELASDVADGGIVLSGGASQLRELDRVLAQATGVSVVRVDDPLGAAARGCARFLAGQAQFGDCVLVG